METTVQEDAVGCGDGQHRSRRPAPTLAQLVQVCSSSVETGSASAPRLANITWDNLTPWQQLWVGCACARGAVVGSSASVPGQGWSFSESSLVLEDYICFLCSLFWITILPIPSCLSLLNVYNSYTETATNL